MEFTHIFYSNDEAPGVRGSHFSSSSDDQWLASEELALLAGDRPGAFTPNLFAEQEMSKIKSKSNHNIYRMNRECQQKELSAFLLKSVLAFAFKSDSYRRDNTRKWIDLVFLYICDAAFWTYFIFLRRVMCDEYDGRITCWCILASCVCIHNSWFLCSL